MTAGTRCALVLTLVFGLGTASLGCATFGSNDTRIERSVVRILNHSQRGLWFAPWDAGATSRSSGSGFIIEGGRVMTNAHVVSDARVILIYLWGDPGPHEARVVAVGHDCDLALIEPVDPSVLDGFPAMKFGGLPELRSRVETYGYPAGGERLSSTRGVVSRIEKKSYAHSGGDSHLTVQTDAAINPGNSGGPVVQNGRVAGVAFQASSKLENVGFFIPTEVIGHFLDDVADGAHEGYPDFGVRVSNLENPAARRRAQMRDDESGIRVDFVFPGSSADGHLRAGDVLLEVKGYAIANDGTVQLDGMRLSHELLVDRKQVGESLRGRRLRDGVRSEISIPMSAYEPFNVYRKKYDELPRYYVYAGLVFVPLGRDVLGTLGAKVPQHLVYETYLRSLSEPDQAQRESIALLRRLDDPVNANMAWHKELVVDRVNGQEIDGLASLIDAIERNDERFHVFEFGYFGRFGVIDREAADAAHGAILERYGVGKDRRL